MSPLELSGFIQLAVAVVLGAVMGVERALAGKHAGMRTYALVALGACLFTLVGTNTTDLYLGLTDFDPLRIAAAIVMGIGFVGTGLVVLRGGHPVGLTTAVGVWVAGAVGVAVGFGLYGLALATTALTIGIFTLLLPLERWLENLFGNNTPTTE